MARSQGYIDHVTVWITNGSLVPCLSQVANGSDVRLSANFTRAHNHEQKTMAGPIR